MCMFPAYKRKEKGADGGMGKKEAHFYNNNYDFIFPVSVVHILDKKPVIGVKQLLAAGACNSF